ncbi:MAG: sigma factor regulator FecR [Deltaproteobacteria bacterium]|nr:MAG: sigma factor regulator FecR [Deltaproteobacteria bacterium]
MEPAIIIAEKILASKKTVVFTGAGISTESGIPDYRSQGGIWDSFRPVYFDEFMSSESARIRYWEQRMEMEKSLGKARPNIGHKSIADLYEAGFVSAVITQNIDGLHQASGIPEQDIIELHGNTRRVRCMTCKKLFPWDMAEKMIHAGQKAPVCECGGYLKPDTVSFGQAMPEDDTRRATQMAEESHVFLVVGSTLVVQPASLMPAYAYSNGAFLAIITLSPTPYDAQCHVKIEKPAGSVLQDIASHVLKSQP